MPIGTLRNTLYGLALPLLGRRCEWKDVQGGDERTRKALRAVLRKHHAVGACVQVFQKGVLTDCYTAGNAVLEPERQPVTQETIFRTASVAKMVNALLVFRLQTLNRLSIFEDISALWGSEIRNPYFPDAPVTLGMLLGHTSSLVDSPAYFASLSAPVDLSALLADRAAYADDLPGLRFRYSNFAAGLVGCLLEKRFGESLETLSQRELFEPLGIRATYDLSALRGEALADGYGVLPSARRFNAQARAGLASPLDKPDPERHYQLASGNLYLTATELAKLALVAWNGHDGFLNAESLAQMQSPVSCWPEKAVRMRHGMGMAQVDDRRVCSRPLWGHQGFAYGAVTCVFFDEAGNGFSSLGSGASERRTGHLSCFNRDLIKLFLA